MKYHNFDKLSDLLTSVAKNAGIDAGISQIALFRLWSEVVGKRFCNTTKTVKLHNKILTIATKSPAVTQELTMFREDILKKFSVLTKNLDIEIKDLKFNHKIWYEVTHQNEKPEEKSHRKYLPAPSEGDLNSIELPQNIKDEIVQSFRDSENLTPEMKEKITETVLKDIKRQIWKKERNYPICKTCGIVLDYIDEGEEPLCAVCKNETLK